METKLGKSSNGIEITKNTPRVISQSDKIQKMEGEIGEIFRGLIVNANQFNSEKIFLALIDYLIRYDRFLYSTLTNKIYANYDNGESDYYSGTLLTNLDALVSFVEDTANIVRIKQAYEKKSKKDYVEDAIKLVYKIWDHVSLANQQYTILKQSDEEYGLKFKKHISSYQEDITKEMNAQMITMVGIFTALAFLVFGSISSFDGIFENLKLPILKAMSIGLIWGICISNMIFVFLYCVGKMTQLNFKANDFSDANIFQRYPVVWWTNLVLLGLLLLSTWMYFIQKTKIGIYIFFLADKAPVIIGIIGCLLIFCVIGLGMVFLSKKTRYSQPHRGKHYSSNRNPVHKSWR